MKPPDHWNKLRLSALFRTEKGIHMKSAKSDPIKLTIVLTLTLLVSSDFPGAGAPMWQYFGASLDHSVLGICFVAFLIGKADSIWAVGGREE